MAAYFGNHKGILLSQAKALAKQCKMALLFSFLSRCELLFRLKRGNLGRSFFESVKFAFDELLKNWDSKDLANTALEENITTSNGETRINDAEKEEFLYRQYFPNHAQEFLDIMQSVDISEGYTSVATKSDDEMPFTFSANHLFLLCSLHRTLFSESVSDVDDACRIRSFKWGYQACCQIAPALEWFEQHNLRFENVGGHIMGLAMSSAISKGRLSSHVWNQSSCKPEVFSIDFNNDPNPAEVIKAEPLLCKLLLRVVQLLRAFPGNAILFTVKQVIERVCQLNFDEVPVGKVLKGLELILKKAEEWEHQASRRVTIGQPLQNISALVSKWRKLELESWSSLLDMCEQRCIQRARVNWTKLFLLVCGEELTDVDEMIPSEQIFSPSWFCKGFCTEVKTWFAASPHFDTFCMNDQVLFDFVKVIDGFILNCGVGEFDTRLQLIKSFANQVFRECEDTPMSKRKSKKYYRRLSLARLLGSLHKYYFHYSLSAKSFITEMRTPIEKQLKEDVKLAKWDEQSYYALAESAEKSHRKLSKHLRAYGEALEAKVSAILERDLTSGIRVDNESNHGPVTKMPQQNALFPLVFAIDCETCGLAAAQQCFQLQLYEERNWTEFGDFSELFDKYVQDMKRYSNKMRRYLLNIDISRDKSSMRCGSAKAESVSKAIFDRIGCIRNAPKLVKQRALVDLFKTLKNEGFSSLKWSVPSQIREIQHIFQLPDPSKYVSKLFNDFSQLHKAESYFQRSCAEISRLRREVTVSGSSYMSQRELTLMIGFAEHFLLVLCQQRTILSVVAESLVSMQEYLAQFDNIISLEAGQAELRSSVDKFNEAFISALESCRQLLLLMVMSCDLICDPKKLSCVRDFTSTVKCCIDKLDSTYSPYSVQSEFVSSNILLSIKQACIVINMTEQELLETSQKCKQYECLPCDIFSGTLSALRSVLQSAEFCQTFSTTPSTRYADSTNTKTLCNAISSLVQTSLVFVQKLHKESNYQLNDKATRESISDAEVDKESGFYRDEKVETLMGYHLNSSFEWAHTNTANLAIKVQDLSVALFSAFDTAGILVDHGDIFVGACKDACTMASQVLDAFKKRLVDTVDFYKEYAKLTYILARIFRNLVAKGFCSDSSEENDNVDANVDGMTFEDNVEGTGMGEGVGMDDVTDQIENEEQILGLKGDQQAKNEPNNQEQRQLDEEQADIGMEMENDFDGEMFDTSEKNTEEDAPEKDDEVELDREMGAETSPNEEVIDEKMWDEDGDQDAENQQEEKFEKDSKVNGESIEGETRTKDDAEDGSKDGKEQGTKNETESGPLKDEESKEDEKQRDEGLINEDTAEKYEDSPNGVEVRDERSETNKVDKSDDMQDDPEMLLNEDMNLDELDPDDESGKQENDDEIDQSDLHDEYNPDIDASMDHQEDEVNDDVENPDIAQAFGDGGVANIEEPPEEDEESSGEADSVDLTDAKNKSNEVELGIKQKNFGVKSMNGIDAINQEEDEKSAEITENGDGAESISGQDKQEALRGSSRGGTNDTTGNISHGETDNAINEKSHGKPQLDHPNPFRSPGDAEKFWHNRLEMIDDKVYDEDVEESQNAKSTDNYGDVEEQQHEFSRRGEDSTTQVLGATMDEFATDLDLNKNDEEVENKVLQEQKDNVEDEELNEIRNDKKATSYPENKQKDKSKVATDTVNENNKVSENIPQVEGEVTDDDSNCNAELDAMSDCLPAEEADDVGVENQEPEVKNKVVLDLAQLRLQQDEGEDKSEIVSRYDLMEAYCHPLGGLTTEMVMKGRSKWVNLNFETLPISRRLCEKLRLVMEPLVAAKLRGDYRSGKRINMKRIIGYIASGYRKDKIWLRRTKPSKRDYRVLLAVDNSESMAKTGAGGMALLALAALANGMSQLEVGELGVASFGETMRLLHPFSAPFTVESGANIACNLGFDEKRTRTALCVENVITALEEAGGGLHSSLQLVFIISDGRIERDSRSKLRRLVREMSERNMLCVMIIVEGTHDSSSATVKRHSIMDMKEATFSNGIPKLVHFIDDYPFPYYMVLEDMTSLPEVLGDALRQWFEILAQIAT